MVRDEGERQERALDALYARMSESLVAIVDGPPNEDKFDKPNGSGTLVVSPTGNVVVLTAAHVLDNPPDGHTVVGKNLEPVHNPFVGTWKHPDGERSCDVAVALLAPNIADGCRKHAISLDSLAPAGFEPGATDWVFLCGFPGSRRLQQEDRVNKIKHQHYVSVAYATSVEGKDSRGRYKTSWDKGIASDDAPANVPKAFGIRPGETFDQGLPHGVSGGPLWCAVKMKTSEIWSAVHAAKLIAINESWDKGTIEFCPSTDMWRAWLIDTLRKIDEKYPVTPGEHVGAV
jgi:hypothetical protein